MISTCISVKVHLGKKVYCECETMNLLQKMGLTQFREELGEERPGEGS